MKHIIIGNGVNIELGDYNEYSCEAIINRLTENLKSQKYGSIIFGGKVNDLQLLGFIENFVGYYNNMIDGKYDNVFTDTYKSNVLSNLKRIGRKAKYLHEIGFEDWFFILEIICKHANLPLETSIDIQEAFRRILLDSIYNEGRIQSIYSNAPECFDMFINEFSNIFTVNYDENIDKLAHNIVYHIHGNFNVLANPCPKTIPLGYEHCFCNATMSYDGVMKMFQNALDDNKYIGYEIIKNINGELHILGMSPLNDFHLIDAINGNSLISNIVCYVASKKDEKLFRQAFTSKNVKYIDVFDFWKSF